MPPGALFRMTFAVDDLRFETSIELIGRFGYLQYSFHLPASLTQADRHRHTRFPFRPRENPYVIAQDAGIPGIGVAGPLVNISMGGMALRVAREKMYRGRQPPRPEGEPGSARGGRSRGEGEAEPGLEAEPRPEPQPPQEVTAMRRGGSHPAAGPGEPDPVPALPLGTRRPLGGDAGRDAAALTGC
jgi:hypothetical protein